MTWFYRFVASLVFAGALLGVSSSSSAAQAHSRSSRQSPVFTYDVSVLALVDDGPQNAVGASPAQLTDTHGQSAVDLMNSRGARTIPLHSFIATEAATCVALDAVPCL